MLRKFLIVALGLFGFSFVLFLGALSIVIFTPSPAQWLLDSMNHPQSGQSVSYESVEGNILKGFTVKSLVIQGTTAKLTLPQAMIRYDLMTSYQQKNLILSEVSCADCSIHILDPMYFYRAPSAATPETSPVAPDNLQQKISKKAHDFGFSLQKFLLSNFQFTADFSKVSPEKRKELSWLPDKFQIKEALLDQVSLKSQGQDFITLAQIEKFRLDSAWVSAQASGLHYESSTNQLTWKGDLSLKLEKNWRGEAFKKPIEAVIALVTNEKQEREYYLSAFQQSFEMHIPLNFEGATLSLRNFTPQEYFHRVAPIEKVNYLGTLSGKPHTWGQTPLQGMSFSLGNESYQLKEFNEGENRLLFSDGGANEVGLMARIAEWPLSQIWIYKSSRANAESLFKDRFPESVESLTGDPAGIDYITLLKSNGVELVGDVAFTQVKAAPIVRTPASTPKKASAPKPHKKKRR